jgi:hypothetical protein
MACLQDLWQLSKSQLHTEQLRPELMEQPKTTVADM